MTASNQRASSRTAAALFAAASLFGAAFAFAAPDEPSKAPATSASGPASAASAPSASAAPAAASAAPAAAPAHSSGLAPMPGGLAIPKKFLPPGSEWPDVGPSHAIYPPQKLPLRFNHKEHVVGQKLPCTYCHEKAEKSTQVGDALLPKKHDLCLDCHSIEEDEPFKDDSPPARCDACHLGTKTVGDKVTVPKVFIPTPNLKFSHKAHVDKKIACETCHGQVGQLELATRDQLPRMRGCFDCHQSGAAGGLGKNGAAKSDCKVCHITEKDGVLKTMFASGYLLPPKWLKNSHHGADWIERHRKVAGADSAYCGSCHTEQYCVACHDGKVKPRSVHPNDWLNMHAVAARFDQPKCVTCHSTTNFCTPCHTRAGVAQQSPAGVASAVRFHPPASTWSAPKRVPGHHSYEAQKNINACVSCHVERDCVVCHGTQGVGGAGANPHGPSFIDKCDTMFAKNPRPCFVCHDPGDKNIERCR